MSVVSTFQSSVRPMEARTTAHPSRVSLPHRHARGTDVTYVIAGVIFALSHAQSIVPAAAPAGLLLSVGVAATSRQGRGSAHIQVAGLVVVGVAMLGIATALANGLLEGTSLLPYIRERAPFVYVAAIAACFALLRPRWPSAVSFCIGFATAAAAIAAFTALVAFSGSEYFLDIRWVRRGRYQGPLSGPNSFAGVMAPALLCTAAFWRASLPGWIVLRVPVLIATAFGLLLTASRGYLLGVLLAGVVLTGLLSVRSWRTRTGRTAFGFVLVLLLAAASFLAASERITTLSEDRNVTSRVEFWQRSSALLNDSPIIGFGFGIFEQHDLVIERSIPLFAGRAEGEYRETLVQFDADGGQHAHNFFLQMGVDTGLLGLGLYLGFLLFGARSSRAARALLVLGAVAGLFGGYALASASGSAPLLLLCLAGTDGGLRGLQRKRTSPQIAWSGPKGPELRVD